MLISIFLYSCAALFGCIIGSFLNVCILRIPNKENFITGRSYCPACHTVLKPYDMIPILSYLFLKGRCRTCKSPISPQYPLIELLTALMFPVVFRYFGFGTDALLICLLGCVLTVLSVIDFRTMTIPDGCHILIFLLALLRLILTPAPLTSALAGFFIMSVPMLILALLTGGFGGGDIKLCAVCGLFLGWQALLLGTVLGCLAAGLYSILLIYRKKATAKTAIAFGPFLSLGFFLSLFMEPLLQLIPALY